MANMPMGNTNQQSHATQHLSGFAANPSSNGGHGMHFVPPPSGAPGGHQPPQPPTGPGDFGHPASQEACGQGIPRPTDVEAKVRDVLSKMKGTDLIPFSYVTNSKAVDFENWVTKMRWTLNAKHTAIGHWWDLVVHNARAAYGMYLSLSPLQRSAIRPGMEGFLMTDIIVERYLLGHLILTMPQHLQNTLMHTASSCAADVLFQAMVDAGPGTKHDRAQTLQSVGTKGPQVPPHAVLRPSSAMEV